MLELNCIKEAVSPRHWNQARRDFFARFLIALITSQTVCLTRIASLFPREAHIASRYHRIRRFFGGYEFEQSDLAKVVIRLAQKAGAQAPFVLAFDRTEWRLGKVALNVFVIGIVHQRVVFPLLWTILEKPGSSNTTERIDLLQKAVALLGKENIAFILGDREFLSEGLLQWLETQKIGFRLRLRQDILLTNGHGQAVTAGWIFRRFGLGAQKQLAGRRECLGHCVFVSGIRFRNEKNVVEFLIVVSNEPAAKNSTALADYGLRWGIENLFSGLKSRGFDLEARHLLQPERLSRLLSVLAIACAWCVVVGEFPTRGAEDATEREPAGKGGKVGKVSRKGHGRLARSTFREGLDILRSLLAPLCGCRNQPDFKIAIQILYGT